MEHTYQKQKLKLAETICSEYEERSVDMDIILPDYCADIAVVLKCTITPRISRCFRNGDRYSVDGSTNIRILYLSEDRTQLHFYETSQPFNVSFCVNDAIHCETNAKADYVNCRAVSAKRMDIHGAFRVYLTAVGCEEYSVSSPMTAKEICCKTDTICTTIPVLQIDKTFTVNDVFPLGNDIERVVYSDLSVVSIEHKLLVNKVILKGTLRLHSIVIKNGMCGEFCEEMPFSQIIDADGLTDEWKCHATVSVGEYDIRMQPNESGSFSLMMNAKLITSLYFSINQNSDIVLDAYSVSCPLLCETLNINVSRTDSEPVHDEKMTIPLKVALPENTVSLIDVWGEVHCDTSETGQIDCCFTINAVVCDKDGKLSCVELPAHEKIACGSHQTPYVRVSEMKGIVSAGTLHIQADVHKTLTNNDPQYLCVVSDMLEDTQHAFAKCKAAIRIIYTDGGESVWDIAKEHHTSVDAIICENDLDTDEIPSPMMLMLPV